MAEDNFPAALVDALQKALEAVVPANATVAVVQNDTFGTTTIPLNS